MNPQLVKQMVGNMGLRLDDAQSVFLATQLEHVTAQTYDVKFPEFKARSWIPVDNSAPPGADTIAYTQYSEFGKFKRVGNQADDSPRVGVLGKKFLQEVHTFEGHYHYSLVDLERAAMSGVPLDAMQARAARRAAEQTLDEYAFLGDAAVGVTGMFNNPNVPIVTLPHAGSFSGLTALQVVENITHLITSVGAATNNIFQADAIVADPATYATLATKTVGVDNITTVMKTLLANSPSLQGFDQSHLLKTAGVGGIKRIVAFKRDPEVMSLSIPMEFRQLAPQAHGTKFVVPCLTRYAGFQLKYAKAMAYADIAL